MFVEFCGMDSCLYSHFYHLYYAKQCISAFSTKKMCASKHNCFMWSIYHSILKNHWGKYQADYSSYSSLFKNWEIHLLMILVHNCLNLRLVKVEDEWRLCVGWPCSAAKRTYKEVFLHYIHAEASIMHWIFFYAALLTNQDSVSLRPLPCIKDKAVMLLHREGDVTLDIWNRNVSF